MLMFYKIPRLSNVLIVIGIIHIPIKEMAKYRVNILPFKKSYILKLCIYLKIIYVCVYVYIYIHIRDSEIRGRPKRKMNVIWKFSNQKKNIFII